MPSSNASGSQPNIQLGMHSDYWLNGDVVLQVSKLGALLPKFSKVLKVVTGRDNTVLRTQVSS